MKIIIEGSDGTGKTTLSKFLAKELDLQFLKLNNNDPRDLNFYSELLRKDDIVYDRQFISEFIYPKYFNRPQKLKEYEFEYLIKKSKDLDVIIIILTNDLKTIKSRLKNNEYPFITKNIENINDDYMKIAGKYELKVFNNKSKEEILSWIKSK